MSLTKVNYIDNSTIITAQNLNDIQDNIIQNAQLIKKAAPRNLLDNSDFRNPVNQRGVTVSNNGFIVDRWYAFDGDVTISENGIFTTGNGYIQQRFPSGTINPGNVYTLAVYYSDGTIDVNTNGEYASIADFDLVNYIKSNGKTIASVALYEGEYTAETLPEYQPKGYGAELAECQRYYRHFAHNAFLGWAVTDTDGVHIQGSIPDVNMRIDNPTCAVSLGFWDGEAVRAVTLTAFISQGNGIRVNAIIDPAASPRCVGSIFAHYSGGISADL